MDMDSSITLLDVKGLRDLACKLATIIGELFSYEGCKGRQMGHE